ncbi:MAG: AAA family ATPase [Bacteroidetes bacterium]|nr:AAA family ATPase [Bacteroidota bacterium]
MSKYLQLHEAFQNQYDDNTEALMLYYILKNTNHPVFLTGKAGTGKTTLIKELRKLYDHPYVVAPTGIAAETAGGYTIHKLFNLPPELLFDDDERLLKIYPSSKYDDFCVCDFLVIDEISMVSSAMLDIVDKLLRKWTNINKPFGGISVLMVGDPFQLPPVLNKENRTKMLERYASEYFFDAKIFKELKPIKIELQKNYRQKDEVFMSVLNNIRVCENLPTTLQHVNKHCVGNITVENAICLTYKNAVADNINKVKLESLKGQPAISHANISGNFDWKNILVSKTLLLKKEARVMFVVNDAEGQFVNGTLGTVQGFNNEKVIVLTDDNKTIEVAKRTWKTYKAFWEYDKKKGYGSMDVREVGSMSQFPLKLAWAISIHKSQGMTFNEVYFCNEGKAFEAGQVYVALSRCRTLEGLRLQYRLMEDEIFTNGKVAKFCRTNHEVRLNKAMEDAYQIEMGLRKKLEASVEMVA